MNRYTCIGIVLTLLLLQSCHQTSTTSEGIKTSQVHDSEIVGDSPTLPVADSATAVPTIEDMSCPPTILQDADGNNQPLCSMINGYYRCYDKTLEVSFEYPSIWGEISSRILNENGESYHIHFSDWSGGNGAIGNSYSPYTGFAEGSAHEYCANREASAFSRVFLDCNVINEYVVIVFIYPAADTFCFPSGRSYAVPHVEILIDNPDNDINGPFRFGMWLFSRELENQMDNQVDLILGADRNLCDQDAMSRLDEWLLTLIENLAIGEGDHETIHNLNNIEHFAKSIITCSQNDG